MQVPSFTYSTLLVLHVRMQAERRSSNAPTWYNTTGRNTPNIGVQKPASHVSLVSLSLHRCANNSTVLYVTSYTRPKAMAPDSSSFRRSAAMSFIIVRPMNRRGSLRVRVILYPPPWHTGPLSGTCRGVSFHR